MMHRLRKLVACESLAGFLEQVAQESLAEVRAEKCVLVLLQDFLLAERKLTYIRLSEQGEQETGGYIYSVTIPERRRVRTVSGPHPMRRIMRETLRRGRTVPVQDAEKDPIIRSSTALEELDFRSAICVPIRANGISGLLYLDHGEPGRFGPQESENLELLADIASLRIRELLNFRDQFLLSQAMTRFHTTLDRSRLVESILNEFKLRLGFSRTFFFRVNEDAGVGILERSLPEEWKESLSLEQVNLPVNPEESLYRRLFVERHSVCLTGLRKDSGGTLFAYMDGKKIEIRDRQWVQFLDKFGLQPFLAIPLCVPDQVVGILACDRLGLPIILSEEGKKFLGTLCEAFALAMERADRYREMKERLDRIYEERIRREALARQASLVKDLSHVISSPVRSLINTASTVQNALKELESKDDSKSALGELKRSVDHMQNVSLVIRNYVTYLRDLVRTEALDPVMVEADIQECITDAWQGRVARFFPSVRMEIRNRGPAVPPFLFDSVQIASVLANLFMNAARAMQATGGTIRLTVALDGEMVRIVIEDQGPGIPEDLLRDLFSLEKRMSPDWGGEGGGTGLLLCKEILFRHQANLEVRSTGGTHLRNYGSGVDFIRERRREKGTEVILELPFRREAGDSVQEGAARADQL